MVEAKLDLLGSLSGLKKRSSHGKDEFMSVTVRKDDAKDKVGIRLEADINGRIRVVNIATNGLFANSEVEIGDIVLSVNGKRLGRGEGPEALMTAIAKASSKVTVVVKKTSVEPRVPEKPKKEASAIEDNNVVRVDTYYAGQSKHKEDGSIAFHTKEEVERNKNKNDKDVIVSCSITANKDNGKGNDIDDSAGIIFVVQNKLLFVANIDKRSCFRKTDLAIGDRVLSINDCNFRSYADAAFALNIVIKAANTVTIVVEKRSPGFTPISSGDTKKSRSDVPSRDTNGSSKVSGDLVPGRSQSKRNSTKDDTKGSKRQSSTKSSTTSLPKDDSTDALTVDSFDCCDDEDSFGGDDILVDLPLSQKSYREVIIVAPKKFASQEVGVLFKTYKNRCVIVKEIQPNSIFAKTSLELGDVILEINGTDYRNNPDKLDAWKTCRTTKETVTMLVGKTELKFKQEEFNLDGSVTNLEWH